MRKKKLDRCTLWPGCTCAYSWQNYERILVDDWRPNTFVLDYAEVEIFNLLNCVARNCPDPEFRRHAVVQLMHPVFYPQHEQEQRRKQQWETMNGFTIEPLKGG